MTRDQDFTRSQEKPFDFARLRALKRVRDLGSTHDEVNDALGIVGTAFGAEWLNSAAEDIPHGRALPFREHPIGDLISTAGDEQLTELIELGRYLRLVAPVPGAEDLISALKGGYRPAFFHLTFAAMTIQAGGIIERMEPRGEGGRFADIDAVIAGDPIRIECFRPTYKADDKNDLYLLAQHAIASVDGDLPVLSIAIEVKGELTVELRRAITGETTRMIRDVVTRASKGEYFPAALTESDEAFISVAQSVPAPPGEPSSLRLAEGFIQREGDPDLFLRAGHAERSAVAGIDGTVGTNQTLSHVAIWLPSDASDWPITDAAAADGLVKLGRKIEKKLAQARDSGGRGRLLAVDSWLTRELHRLTGSDLMRLRNKIVEEHTEVRGLLMMHRQGLKNTPGFEYLLKPLVPATRTPIAADFLQCLSRLSNVRMV